MNGVKAGITSSEAQLTGLVTAFLSLHDKVGFELNEATLSAIVFLGTAYIASRTVVKVVTAWKAPQGGGE